MTEESTTKRNEYGAAVDDIEYFQRNPDRKYRARKLHADELSHIPDEYRDQIGMAVRKVRGGGVSFVAHKLADGYDPANLASCDDATAALAFDNWQAGNMALPKVPGLKDDMSARQAAEHMDNHLLKKALKDNKRAGKATSKRQAAQVRRKQGIGR